jgi:hypothetical protein
MFLFELIIRLKSVMIKNEEIPEKENKFKKIEVEKVRLVPKEKNKNVKVAKSKK